MKNKFITLAASLFCMSGVCQMPGFFSPQGETYEIIMSNRVLAKINGKTFSVMDVKKKMDLFLHEHHPESLSSNLLLYQFYTQNWRQSLQEMIDNELIKMEAVTFKINISDGDVRQEMDKRFGPNLVKRLDELKLSYEEAKQIVHDDIVVRNMQWYRIWARVLQDVTPETVKAGYETYLAKLQLKDDWTYKVATLKGPNQSEEAAIKAYNLLLQEESEVTPIEVKGISGFLPTDTSLQISEPITISTKDLSNEIVKVLEDLPANTFSKPIAQKSKSDGSTVFRMYYLIDHKKESPPSFEQVSAKIHETLVQRYGDLQREEYFTKLRKRFLSEDLVVKNLFPPSYQPFNICGS
ncbi:MAG: hypothetical protein FJZ59_00455 [Chlamydiae bacterium]|nr:hypothetical protein [Chlamydiota bacterium]